MTEIRRCATELDTVHLFEQGKVKTLCNLPCARFLVVSNERTVNCLRCFLKQAEIEWTAQAS